MPDPQYPLFVYGTLRRGEENHHHLDGRYARMVPAVLPGYCRIAPIMIAPQSGSEVPGELYFLKPDQYATTMAGCDELEELYPGQMTGAEYQRKLMDVVTAEGAFSAWAYVQAD